MLGLTPFTTEWFDAHGWELGGHPRDRGRLHARLPPVGAPVPRGHAPAGTTQRGAAADGPPPWSACSRASFVVVAWAVFLLTLLKASASTSRRSSRRPGSSGSRSGSARRSLVRDTISGLFIFLEGQFDVGDIVDLTTNAGTVSGTSRRSTCGRRRCAQYDGSLSTIPNGLIEVTNNRTRGWGRAVVDVRVALDEDPDRVREALEELFERDAGRPPLDEWLRQPPAGARRHAAHRHAQVIRIAAETSRATGSTPSGSCERGSCRGWPSAGSRRRRCRRAARDPAEARTVTDARPTVGSAAWSDAALATVDELHSRAGRARVPGRPRPRDGDLPVAVARQAAAAGGRGRCREDRGREGARGDARPAS